MMTSNNSPLLKGSQELTKTKGTIWKPLIAVSLLSIFSFTVGQYLPYVIAAVSGSGAIAAVPLAIFAVSAVVALISTIYLIRLAVSRADNKKEAGLDREEPSHIASQEPQKFVCENCTSLENKPIGEEPIKQDSGSQTEVDSGTSSRDKSSVPTPPPVTLGTQPSVSVPPPPPPPPENSSTHPMRKVQDQQQLSSASQDDRNALLESIRKGTKLKKVGDKFGADKKPSNKDLMADLLNTLQMRRRGIDGPESTKQQSEPSHSNTSDSKLSDHNDSDDWSDNEQKESKKKKLTKRKEKSTPSTPRSDSNKRRDSSDSGHGSDNDVKSKPTSPSHSMPKVGKPPAPLKPDDVQTGFQSSPPPEKEKPPVASKPANLQTGPQPSSPTKVNNVEPVNSEVQEPSTLSVKDRCRMFGGMTNEYEKPSMVSVY